MDDDPVGVPEGLTQRARAFVRQNGVRVDALDVTRWREPWLGFGIPAEEIDRVAAYQRSWGGLVLPPALMYGGGPRYLNADTPEPSPDDGWWFEAGLRRTAVQYGFMIGPTGEFGIHGDHWVPLHASVEGWVESLSLAHHAIASAHRVTRLTGDEVEIIDLDEYELVPEVEGLADSWWRDDDTLIAVYTGEAEAFAAQEHRTTIVYEFASSG
ncbi:hypothetical protein [Actinophytocola algeriensis]|uniref:Uncharacterized protein n=1 Tax=Actinophytocola algeriensis TaxID=1768010 RepID=A0A7W7Q406_9PSEU|nr:hypothetical protein [Actinophytocola algeriensis]MBB4906647.1 hypothetical protein [Actinophytocola algeriensis]MBE1478128.1 hypothetical protein [Actinophytocola algeriensis]